MSRWKRYAKRKHDWRFHLRAISNNNGICIVFFQLPVGIAAHIADFLVFLPPVPPGFSLSLSLSFFALFAAFSYRTRRACSAKRLPLHYLKPKRLYPTDFVGSEKKMNEKKIDALCDNGSAVTK